MRPLTPACAHHGLFLDYAVRGLLIGVAAGLLASGFAGLAVAARVRRKVRAT